MERRLPARAGRQLHRRDRLRRQPRPGHHPAPRPQRRPLARREQRRPPAVRAVRAHVERDRVPAVPHRLPLAADEGRPALQERLPDHQLLHARQGRELRRRRFERLHQHADRHRAELGPHGQRSQAHLRQQLRLRPAVPEGGLARRRRQRLADLRHLHRPVGHRAGHHHGRRAAQHARQHAAAGYDPRSRDPRQRRRRRDLVRHDGVRGAGGEHVRQPDPDRIRRQRAGLRTTSTPRLSRRSPSAAASPSSASTPST